MTTTKMTTERGYRPAGAASLAAVATNAARAAAAQSSELDAALSTAAETIAARDHASAALSRSHIEIPKLLTRRNELQAALSSAELAGEQDAASRARQELAAVEASLAVLRRMRQAALAALLDLEQDIISVRGRLDEARKPLLAEAAGEFEAKRREALRAIGEVQALGVALAAAGCKVSLDVPLRTTDLPASTIPGRDASTLYRLEIHPYGQQTPIPVKVWLDLPDPDAATADAPAIDPTLSRSAEALAQLDAGLATCSAIHGVQTSETGLGRSSTAAPAGFTATGTYRVVGTVRSPYDGSVFPPGALVDASVIPPGHLQRLFRSKLVRLADGSDARPRRSPMPDADAAENAGNVGRDAAYVPDVSIPVNEV